MKSQEKQKFLNINEINEVNSKTITQKNFFKEKAVNTQNNKNFLSLLNNSLYNTFNLKKQNTDFKLKSNSTSKRQLPLLTYSSVSFYDSLPSDANGIDINSLKKKLILNKSNINKKKAELQDLKIQFNKLMKENKNHKNLIYEILQLENEVNNNSKENNKNNNNLGQVTEEQLISKINNCSISDSQKKRLRDSYNIINLRTEINSKRKLLLSRNHEYDKLKDNLKYKQMNEITSKLEDLIIDEKKIKNDIIKLEEILKKNNESIPVLEKEYEKEEKNYEELIKKEKEYKTDFNNKLHKLNELKTDIQNIGNKSKSKKIPISQFTSSPEYKGAKTIGIKIKAKIDKMKYDLKYIEQYKNKKRDEIVSQVSERRSKVNEQKKKNDELEIKINELSEKNKELYFKTIEYDEEKKKLENRGRESNKDIKRMKELLLKLDNTKSKKEELIKECEEKEKILKDNENTQKEKNKEIFEKLNSLKNNINNMNEQVNLLGDKINEIQDDIDKYEQQITDKKIEIQKINNEIDKGNNEEKINENDNQNLEELENKKNNYINENDNYKKENEKLKNQIKLLEEQIQKYIGANDKLQKV